MAKTGITLSDADKYLEGASQRPAAAEAPPASGPSAEASSSSLGISLEGADKFLRNRGAESTVTTASAPQEEAVPPPASLSTDAPSHTSSLPEFVQRMMMENPPAISNGDGSFSTHKMASAEVDGHFIAFPTIVSDGGKLKELPVNEALQYALKAREFAVFSSEADAQAYANGSWKNGDMRGAQYPDKPDYRALGDTPDNISTRRWILATPGGPEVESTLSEMSKAQREEFYSLLRDVSKDTPTTYLPSKLESLLPSIKDPQVASLLQRFVYLADYSARFGHPDILHPDEPNAAEKEHGMGVHAIPDRFIISNPALYQQWLKDNDLREWWAENVDLSGIENDGSIVALGPYGDFAPSPYAQEIVDALTPKLEAIRKLNEEYEKKGFFAKVGDFILRKAKRAVDPSIASEYYHYFKELFGEGDFDEDIETLRHSPFLYDRLLVDWVSKGQKLLQKAATPEEIVGLAAIGDTLLFGLPSIATASLKKEEFLPSVTPGQRQMITAGNLAAFLTPAPSGKLKAVKSATLPFDLGAKGISAVGRSLLTRLPVIKRVLTAASTKAWSRRVLGAVLEIPRMQAGNAVQSILGPSGIAEIAQGADAGEVFERKVIEGLKPTPEGIVMAVIFGSIKGYGDPATLRMRKKALETLGLKESATEADIKSAYRTMAKKLHPDVGGDEAAFKTAKAAYEFLAKGIPLENAESKEVRTPPPSAPEKAQPKEKVTTLKVPEAPTKTTPVAAPAAVPTDVPASAPTPVPAPTAAPTTTLTPLQKKIAEVTAAADPTSLSSSDWTIWLEHQKAQERSLREEGKEAEADDLQRSYQEAIDVRFNKARAEATKAPEAPAAPAATPPPAPLPEAETRLQRMLAGNETPADVEALKGDDLKAIAQEVLSGDTAAPSKLLPHVAELIRKISRNVRKSYSEADAPPVEELQSAAVVKVLSDAPKIAEGLLTKEAPSSADVQRLASIRIKGAMREFLRQITHSRAKLTKVVPMSDEVAEAATAPAEEAISSSESIPDDLKAILLDANAAGEKAAAEVESRLLAKGSPNADKLRRVTFKKAAQQYIADALEKKGITLDDFMKAMSPSESTLSGVGDYASDVVKSPTKMSLSTEPSVDSYVVLPNYTGYVAGKVTRLSGDFAHYLSLDPSDGREYMTFPGLAYFVKAPTSIHAIYKALKAAGHDVSIVPPSSSAEASALLTAAKRLGVKNLLLVKGTPWGGLAAPDGSVMLNADAPLAAWAGLTTHEYTHLAGDFSPELRRQAGKIILSIPGLRRDLSRIYLGKHDVTIEEIDSLVDEHPSVLFELAASWPSFYRALKKSAPELYDILSNGFDITLAKVYRAVPESLSPKATARLMKRLGEKLGPLMEDARTKILADGFADLRRVAPRNFSFAPKPKYPPRIVELMSELSAAKKAKDTTRAAELRSQLDALGFDSDARSKYYKSGGKVKGDITPPAPKVESSPKHFDTANLLMGHFLDDYPHLISSILSSHSTLDSKGLRHYNWKDIATDLRSLSGIVTTLTQATAKMPQQMAELYTSLRRRSMTPRTKLFSSEPVPPKKPSSLYSARHYMNDLQQRTSLPFGDVFRRMTRDYGMERHAQDTFLKSAYDILKKYKISRRFANTDLDFNARITDILEGKAEPSNPFEKEFSTFIRSFLDSWSLEVRLARTLDYIELGRRIPGAPKGDLAAAEKIMADALTREGGVEALRTFLRDKKWGTISKNYAPHSVLTTIPITGKASPPSTGRGAPLHTRHGVENEYGNSIILQCRGIIHSVMGVTTHETNVRALSTLGRSAQKLFRDAGIEPRKLVSDLDRIAIAYRRGNITTSPITRVLGHLSGRLLTVSFMKGLAGINNILQSLANVDLPFLALPTNWRPVPKAREYFNTFVNESRTIRSNAMYADLLNTHGHLAHWILKKPLKPGHGPIMAAAEVLARTFDLGDLAGRSIVYNTRIHRSKQILKDINPQTVSIRQLKSALVASGIDSLDDATAAEFLRRWSTEGLDSAIFWAAGEHVADVHLRYDPFQRAPAEMGEVGHLAGSILTYFRGMAERLFRLGRRVITRDRRVGINERFRHLIYISTVATGLVIGKEIRDFITGKTERRQEEDATSTWTYRFVRDLADALTWKPGGLSAAIPQQLYELFWIDIGKVVESWGTKYEDASLQKLSEDASRAAKTFLPFYRQAVGTLNVIMKRSNAEGVDVEATKKILSVLKGVEKDISEPPGIMKRSMLDKLRTAWLGIDLGVLHKADELKDYKARIDSLYADAKVISNPLSTSVQKQKARESIATTVRYMERRGMSTNPFQLANMRWFLQEMKRRESQGAPGAVSDNDAFRVLLDEIKPPKEKEKEKE